MSASTRATRSLSRRAFFHQRMPSHFEEKADQEEVSVAHALVPVLLDKASNKAEPMIGAALAAEASKFELPR